MLNKKAQEVLLRATQLISDRTRWIKGAGFRSGMEGLMHNYCALGALVRASRELSAEEYDRNQVESALRKTLYGLNYHRGISVDSYNDNEATTHADVKNLFCETVKREVVDAQTDEA